MFFVWGSPAQKTCDDIGIDEVGIHSFISETLLRIRFTDETSCPQVKMFTDYRVSSLKEFI